MDIHRSDELIIGVIRPTTASGEIQDFTANTVKQRLHCHAAGHGGDQAPVRPRVYAVRRFSTREATSSGEETLIDGAIEKPPEFGSEWLSR
jgi:hypothetical protein